MQEKEEFLGRKQEKQSPNRLEKRTRLYRSFLKDEGRNHGESSWEVHEGSFFCFFFPYFAL